MNFKTRNSNITKVLYIVLALCVISIAFLSIYSMYRQNQEQNQNKGNLSSINAELKNEPATEAVIENGNNSNDGNLYQDNESAVSDILKKKETQPQTQPATQKPTDAPKPNPKPTEPAEVYDALIPVPQATTDKTADLIIEPSEAVEVISVPTVYIQPVSGNISGNYNPDNPEYSVTMNDYRTHMGIDIDSDEGVNVTAVSDGVISDIYDDPLMGKTVVIDHPGNLQSVYMNLQESLPNNILVGAKVKSGEVIGRIGKSALIEITDIPHLHFEMKKGGEFVNPLDYIHY